MINIQYIVMNGPTEILRTSNLEEANALKSHYTTIVPVLNYGKNPGSIVINKTEVYRV